MARRKKSKGRKPSVSVKTLADTVRKQGAKLRKLDKRIFGAERAAKKAARQAEELEASKYN